MLILIRITVLGLKHKALPLDLVILMQRQETIHYSSNLASLLFVSMIVVASVRISVSALDAFVMDTAAVIVEKE